MGDFTNCCRVSSFATESMKNGSLKCSPGSRTIPAGRPSLVFTATSWKFTVKVVLKRINTRTIRMATTAVMVLLMVRCAVSR